MKKALLSAAIIPPQEGAELIDKYVATLAVGEVREVKEATGPDLLVLFETPVDLGVTVNVSAFAVGSGGRSDTVVVAFTVPSPTPTPAGVGVGVQGYIDVPDAPPTPPPATPPDQPAPATDVPPATTEVTP